MQAPVFDGITRELGAVSTRRTFMRLFGGAAAMGAVTLVAGGETQAKSRGRNQGQVSAQGKGKKPKITICYQNQTRTVKKKGYQSSYPGATVGACSVVKPPTGGGTQPSTGGGTQPPVACTTWILSGGPNPTDKIVVDDDLTIVLNNTEVILKEQDRIASTLNPVPFKAKAGDELYIVAYDNGGCRSLSPLWLHCVATGQKREVFTGLASPNCNFPPGHFIDQPLTVI